MALLLACLIGLALVALHHRAHFDPHIVWDGFTLPGFDAHAYVAMAEEPRVFTVAPWGYRILEPALIGTLLPPRWIVPGFEWTARGSLVMASGLLLVYLRARGSSVRAALLCILAVMLTPSVAAVFENPFLVEPFALCLLLVALIAIERSESFWVAALTLALLSLSKEIWVFLLPLIFLKHRGDGLEVAAVRTAAVAAPAVWIGMAMRWMWSPTRAMAAASEASIAGSLATIAASATTFLPEFLVGGLSVLAAAALIRPSAREYLARHALTLLPLLALPLLAATYTGEGAAPNFFAGDVRRLLIYALPFLAGLVVCLDPESRAPGRLEATPRLERTAKALIAVLVVAPLGLSTYSRIDLSTSRDGPYVLGFSRETLRTARKLDRGERVVFDPAERRFAWGVSPASDLPKLRFFLRSGFGPSAHYGIADIRMRETTATLIAPVIDARTLRMTLGLDAGESAWVSMFAGGSKIGEALVGPQPVRATFEIPGRTLFRGDNQIELRCEKAATALPRILRIELLQPPSVKP